MHYLTAILGLLLAALPAFTHNTPSFTQLTQPMSSLSFVPNAVKAAAPTRLKFVYLPDGALARWNPKTDTFEVSKAHWKNAPHALCLLPLFVHESIHAYFAKEARHQGFAWPVTLKDEVAAFYYQLKTEETLSNYTQLCTTWRADLTAERNALATQNWNQFQTAVYERYSRFSGHELPPPPLEEPWISNAQMSTSLVFFKHIYSLRRRTLSTEKFWRKGGSWLRLSPNDLPLVTQDSHYPLYRTMLDSLSLP